MTATLLDGKTLSTNIQHELKAKAKQLKNDKGITPGLAVVIVGDDPASKVYVRHKRTACQQAGFFTQDIDLPATTSEAELLTVINQLNQNDSVHGILVQLPLPKHIDTNKVILAIDPHKDVDGFHPTNVGLMTLNQPGLRSCTAKGIMRILKTYHIDPQGKHAVIVGASNIVGRPLASELLNHNATITVCHRHTQELAQITRQADILIVGVGKPRLITRNMIKPKAVIIDVGINRDDQGALSGDVNFDEAVEIVDYITPVPGGVGPMTVAMLLENTYQAAVESAAK